MAFDSELELYWLNRLSEEENSAFEERFFADNLLFEGLIQTEYDLIETYHLEGKSLSTKDLSDLEKFIFKSPERIGKLKFLKLMESIVKEEKLSYATEAGIESESYLSIIIKQFKNLFAVRYRLIDEV